MTDSAVPIAKLALKSRALVPADAGGGIPLSALLADVSRLTAGEFASRHGAAFLIRWIYDGEMSTPAPLGSREWRKTTDPAPHPLADRSSGATTRDTFFVYRLDFSRRKTLHLGRAHTCEVCVADMSVSSIHADLELSGDGHLIVTDRGSTNGTKVDKQPIEFAEPTTVAPGGAIRFGNIKLTFLAVQQFIDFAQLVGVETASGRIELE